MPLIKHQYQGDRITVAAGGQIDMAAGAKITAAGTQAALIADPTDATTTQAAVVSILAALKGAGIVSSS